ncbi:MAG: hypothetical protein CK521_00230 [Acidimicrobium sp.]|nr:hypothetical protein [Ilumatobacteraceae bacterium]PHX73213.1 MAG: hypothetical protein CK521_00230 [Acidimicrobium sp.]
MVNQPEACELEPYADDLYQAVISSVPAWIASRVSEIASPSCDVSSSKFQYSLAEVMQTTHNVVQKNLRALLVIDVDAQQLNPLHVLRASTSSATQLLQRFGVAPAQRDEYELRAMPDDVYSIGPLTWRDLGEEVHEAGISWGAWKAAMILTRRRADGSIPT